MSAIDPKGDTKYWIYGGPFEGLRFQPTHTGENKQWFEGAPEQNLFPQNNADTGKFFLLFEG